MEWSAEFGLLDECSTGETAQGQLQAYRIYNRELMKINLEIKLMNDRRR